MGGAEGKNKISQNKQADSPKFARTIYIKKVIEKGDTNEKFTGLYDTVTSVSPPFPYFLTTFSSINNKNIGLIVYRVEVDEKERFAWVHLMWCDESKIEVWNTNNNNISSISPPKDSEYIQGEKILLIIKDKEFILTCGSNFSDALAINALIEMGKKNSAFLDVNTIRNIQASNVVDIDLLKKLSREGIKSLIIPATVSYSSLQAISKSTDLKSKITFDDVKNKKANPADYANGIIELKPVKKGMFKTEYLSVDFINNQVLSSPEDEESIVIKTESGQSIKQGQLILKQQVSIVKRTDGMGTMNYKDVKLKILNYYNQVFASN